MTAQERAVMKQALEALEAMKAEFRAYDLPYGSKAYTQGNEASNALLSALEESEPVQMPVACIDALKDAFFEGFTSVATYNDTLLNSPEEAWGNYKPPRITLRQAEPQEAVAKCTNSDSWNCKYCRKTESCDALRDPRNFAVPPPRAV